VGDRARRARLTAGQASCRAAPGIKATVPEARRLKPLDGWSVVWRGRFETRQDGQTWTVDVDFLDFGEKLRLYRDGMPVEVQKSPARFRVGPGATIKASMGVLGMRRQGHHGWP
jgi:hypothetical protein